MTAKAKKTAAKVVRASIYALRCPDTGVVRYIGKANDPDARLKTHVHDGRLRSRPVCNWVAKLVRNNKMPAMTVEAQELAPGDWKEVERQIIAQYRADGHQLLNLADGGDEPKATKEQLQANAVRMQNHPATMAQRSVNGKALNAAMAADPVIAINREVGRRLGRLAWEMRGLGNETLAQKLTVSKEKWCALAKREPEFACWHAVTAKLFGVDQWVEDARCQA